MALAFAPFLESMIFQLCFPKQKDRMLRSASILSGGTARHAAEYLRITALGIPFLSAYNFYSAVEKAGGDARTPVRDMSVSCLMNMVLDYVFVVIIRLGIRGVASATVISQAAAAGLAVIWAASISFP